MGGRAGRGRRLPRRTEAVLQKNARPERRATHPRCAARRTRADILARSAARDLRETEESLQATLRLGADFLRGRRTHARPGRPGSDARAALCRGHQPNAGGVQGMAALAAPWTGARNPRGRLRQPADGARSTKRAQAAPRARRAASSSIRRFLRTRARITPAFMTRSERVIAR
jgi:hypothetical protein